MRQKLVRAAIFLGGFGFVAGTTLFTIAWFTVDIPNANAYINSNRGIPMSQLLDSENKIPQPAATKGKST